VQTLPKIQGEKLTKRFDLRSSTSIAEDGGTIAGSLSYNSVKGAYFDGITNYISYYPSSYLTSNKISISIEFTPSFVCTDGATRYLFSAYTNSVKLLVAKNAGSGISVYIGDGVSVIGGSSVAGLWRVNERNVITAACVSGTNKVWLNGVLAGSSGVAWTPLANYTTAVIGAYYYGSMSSPFVGNIHSISIYNTLLTETEALDLYDNSTFNFFSVADVFLDMKSQTSNGTNQITKDKSGHGRDFKLGDGTTASTMPAFMSPGYDLDGTSDYLLNSNVTGIYNNTYQTIVVAFRPNFVYTNNAYSYLYSSAAGAFQYAVVKAANVGSNALYVIMGGYEVQAIASSIYSPYWKQHGVNVLVVSGISGNTDVWLNGNQILTKGNTVWVPTNSTSIYLGQVYSGTARFNGEIFHFSTYGNKFSQKMSDTQVRYLTGYLMQMYS